MTPELPRDLDQLLSEFCDGVASLEQIDRLEELLRNDAECRRVYLRYLDLHARLLQHPGFWPRQTADQISLEGDAPVPPEQPPEQPSVKSPVLGFLGGVVDYVNHSRRLMFLLVAVMLCSWFVFQIGSVLLGRWFAGNGQVADQGDQNPAAGRKPAGDGLPERSGPAHGTALAWLSGAMSGRWQVVGNKPVDPESWEIGREFTAAQQVKLVAGLGEITFRSGATVIVSAPAQFSVASLLGIDLSHGKLSVRVPHDSSHPGAAGFTINTPAGSVVDLGTEFGVEVSPDRQLDVQVFVGEVEVDRPAADAGGAQPPMRVQAGQTVHAEPGRPTAVVQSTDSRFPRELNPAGDSRDKQLVAYLDFMRQLNPVLWLRMEGKETDRTVHDEIGNSDLTLQWDGPGNPFVKGAVGTSLLLRGEKRKDCVIIPHYVKPQQGKLSVVAWAYAESRLNFAVIAANWKDSAHPFGLFEFGLSGAGGGDLGIFFCDEKGKFIALEEGGEHRFPLHEWQHVAFTTDGTTMRLYRQGKEVCSTKHAGLFGKSAAQSLGIGAKSCDDGEPAKAEKLCWWDGQLDEIAVFNDTLSPEAIKKLAGTRPPQ